MCVCVWLDSYPFPPKKNKDLNRRNKNRASKKWTLVAEDEERSDRSLHLTEWKCDYNQMKSMEISCGRNTFYRVKRNNSWMSRFSWLAGLWYALIGINKFRHADGLEDVLQNNSMRRRSFFARAPPPGARAEPRPLLAVLQQRLLLLQWGRPCNSPSWDVVTCVLSSSAALSVDFSRLRGRLSCERN